MTGVNFSNYGVQGTHTLFLLDKEGMVLEKTATVEDVIKIIDKQTTYYFQKSS